MDLPRDDFIALSFYSKTKTIGDLSEPFVTDDIIFYDMNFHCSTHPVNYGDGTTMDAVVAVGATLDFRNGNLKDIFFKNVTPASNGVITVAGTIVSKKVSDVMKGA